MALRFKQFGPPPIDIVKILQEEGADPQGNGYSRGGRRVSEKTV